MTLPHHTYLVQGSRLASPDLLRSSAQNRRRDSITFILEQAKMHQFAFHKFEHLSEN